MEQWWYILEKVNINKLEKKQYLRNAIKQSTIKGGMPVALKELMKEWRAKEMEKKEPKEKNAQNLDENFMKKNYKKKTLKERDEEIMFSKCINNCFKYTGYCSL